ncbi:DNA-binding MarR family transcriptional regulator [Microcella putealis]|uniref:DNA-binding MarR family transcriptional regulator n=1 Tax=Microcella putealis TaxID=337005 RepID=A0A4Q7LXJ2_9MICO|nr:DNA-binding MarR family transcriptional regulator [Microcella putealis]TQM26637.1 DNA-binding MarR family transcriptional regulator [Microcella putealis]
MSNLPGNDADAPREADPREADPREADPREADPRKTDPRDSDRVASIQAEWRRERPEIDPSPQGIIGRLHRVAAYLTTELEAVYRDFDLSTGEFDVLAALRRAGEPYERTPSELAERTMITSGGLTKRCDRLETAGLIERRVAESDRRGRVVALTPAGLDLIDRAYAAHMRNEHRLIAALDEDDRGALQGGLARWLAHFEGSGVASDAFPART